MEGKLKLPEIATDEPTRLRYSTDASVFRIVPKAVAFPKSVEELKNLVKDAARLHQRDKSYTLTARSAGTCMSGGGLSESVVVDINKHLNKIIEISTSPPKRSGGAGPASHTGRSPVGWVRCQPGIFYRDLEPLLIKRGYIYPSYPASKAIASVGGIVANNSGGELSLSYGKTEDYVAEIKAVLADGQEYTFGPLVQSQLNNKLKQRDFEGQVYRAIWSLIKKYPAQIERMRPKVSKNSTGYLIWRVWDPKKRIFDLSKLLVGSQGTLGIITEVKLNLVLRAKHSRMFVAYLSARDLPNLAKIINALDATGPTALESFDDKTLLLALKYAPQIAALIGKEESLWRFGLSLWPDFLIMLNMMALPRMVILAEYQSNDRGELTRRLERARQAIAPFNLHTHTPKSAEESAKYWTIRRQSFNLLRQKITDRQTVPFIDDLVVDPEYLPRFLPKLNEILAQYPQLTYTIAGHLGSGNFHIIPLMDLTNAKQRAIIPVLAKRVYDLVFSFGGSMSGEHNDGLIRGPYLKQMYGAKGLAIFKEVKQIFDPTNLFNPHKKTDATLKYSLKYIKKDNRHYV